MVVEFPNRLLVPLIQLVDCPNRLVAPLLQQVDGC